MSQKDMNSKIGLSMLRGKTSNQSVPTINFKFNANSDNLTEIVDDEEKSEPIPIPCPTKSSACSSPDESSSRSFSRFLSQRSASLDSKEGSGDLPSPKGSETPGLISRLTKTFEHKINEIRSERNKDAKLSEDSEDVSNTLDEKSNAENASPSKSKSTLVQDITEQTNKLKSEINKSIRPKISELRNRKSSKDQTKSRNSLINSFLNREEALVTEDPLRECDDNFEPAVEAQEAIESFSGNTNSFPTQLNEACATKPVEHSLLPLKDRLMQKVRSIQISRFKIWAIFCVLIYVLPIPQIIVGFSLGLLACWAGISFVIEYDLLDVVFPPKYVEPVPEKTPQVQLAHCEDFYKGWMNKLDDEYCPESYHVSMTHCVLVRLQGATLQLDDPKKKLGKHARHNEEMASGGFVHHREYDLSGSEVVLLPKNLPRKWLWSRKYPICIHLHIEEPSSKLCTPSIPKDTVRSHTSLTGTPVESVSSTPSDAEDESPNSAIDMDSYEEVTTDMCTEKSILLFARSDREKDDWFRRFVVASNYHLRHESKPVTEATPQTPVNEATPVTPTSPHEADIEGHTETSGKTQLNFDQYMAKLLYQTSQAELNISWFNSIIGRIMFDFLHNQYWADKIQERIQRKLSKLHIPYFIGEIIVTGVDLGSTIPHVLSVEPPTTNERGLWVNLAATYTGNFTLSLETKLDLMKLKDRSNADSAKPKADVERDTRSVYRGSRSSDYMMRNIQFDTDTDDSVESSSDDEEEEIPASDFMGASAGGSKRFLRIVDTVAASKYFRHASEWRLLQRALAGVSNTRIELIVVVKRLAGKLTVNIPPPPADRIWYGFKESPELVMVAQPRLAERALNLPFLPEFIQKQLRTVFEKVFVEPNMDDIVIPVMSPLLPGQTPMPHPWEMHGPASPESPLHAKQPVFPDVSTAVDI